MADVTVPAIERKLPIINNVADAFEDSLLRMERILGAFGSATTELMEQVVGSRHPEVAVKSAYQIWLVLRTAEDAFDSLHSDFMAIFDAMGAAPGEVAA